MISFLGKENRGSEGESGVRSKSLTFVSRERVYFNGFNSPSSHRKEEGRRMERADARHRR